MGFELVSPLVAYGADLDFSIRPDGIHPLHYLAVYAPGEAMKFARLLLAAGRDIDPKCDHYNNISGTTPLCWCLTAGRLTKAHYQLATFLIENGCDVLKLVGRGASNRIGQEGPKLLDILRAQPRTTTNLRFTQYFGRNWRADIMLAWAALSPSTTLT